MLVLRVGPAEVEGLLRIHPRERSALARGPECGLGCVWTRKQDYRLLSRNRSNRQPRLLRVSARRSRTVWRPSADDHRASSKEPRLDARASPRSELDTPQFRSVLGPYRQRSSEDTRRVFRGGTNQHRARIPEPGRPRPQGPIGADLDSGTTGSMLKSALCRTSPCRPNVTQGTIECTCGYLVNMLDRTVKLVSPCFASERWPLGYIVHAEGTFSDASEFRDVLLRCVDEAMPEHKDGRRPDRIPRGPDLSAARGRVRLDVPIPAARSESKPTRCTTRRADSVRDFHHG